MVGDAIKKWFGHYMPCCSDAAFFTDLARDTVEPLLKMLFRSFGDNQDLFGFSCSTPTRGAQIEGSQG